MRGYIDGGAQSFTIREEPTRSIFQQTDGTWQFGDGRAAIPTFFDADMASAHAVCCSDCGAHDVTFMWRRKGTRHHYCEECVTVIYKQRTYSELMAL